MALRHGTVAVSTAVSRPELDSLQEGIVQATFEHRARKPSGHLRKMLQRTKTDFVEIATSSAHHLTLRRFLERRARARGCPVVWL